MSFMTYIAREKCGCVTAVCVDEPQYAKFTAKDIASWVKDGRIVERVTGDYARDNFCVCPKDNTKRWRREFCRACGQSVLPL